MNRIFSELRCTMGTERLSSLAIFSVHNKEARCVDKDKVVDVFAETGDKRIAFR